MLIHGNQSQIKNCLLTRTRVKSICKNVLGKPGPKHNVGNQYLPGSNPCEDLVNNFYFNTSDQNEYKICFGARCTEPLDST